MFRVIDINTMKKVATMMVRCNSVKHSVDTKADKQPNTGRKNIPTMTFLHWSFLILFLIGKLLLLLPRTHGFVLHQNSIAGIATHQVRGHAPGQVLLAATTQATSEESLFTQCWRATTTSVNPYNDPKIERILQRLVSPAPQSYFVLSQVQPAAEGPALRSTLNRCNYLVKHGYQFAFSNHEWDVIANDEAPDLGWERIRRVDNTPNTLELAHRALDLAMDACDDQVRICQDELDAITHQAIQQLDLTLGTDIRGRASGDAAFSFCMAGVSDQRLYNTLATVALHELERIGNRPSFRSKYVLQLVEKLAAAGMKPQEVYNVAADCLELKGEHVQEQFFLRNNQLDMLSPRSLLWLWRFSTKQSKQPNEFDVHDMAPYWDDAKMEWFNKFQYPSRPLIVDIGCGMGVSLIGLATLESTTARHPSQDLLRDINWGKCNFAGCDLSQLLIGFARGITKRWDLEHRLQFSVQSGQSLLDSIPSPTAVALILISFPSPFLLQGKTSGNQQLPLDASMDFMVNEQLLRSAARLLQPSKGKLLLQSNCEDVAVSMRDLAVQIGMRCIDVPSPVTETDPSDLSLRTQQWITGGGTRAIGSEWSREAIVPPRGASETDAAREFNGFPIHRCLLQTVDDAIY
jgi:SAM-dependent methyltransferase